MIGERPEGWKWAQASGASVALHAAVLAYFVWQPSFDFLDIQPPAPLAQIEIMALTPQTAPEVPEIPAETISDPQSPQPQILTPDSGSETLTLDSGAETITSSALPEVAPATEPAGEVLSSTIAPPAQTQDPGPLPVQNSAEAPAPDPRMVQMIERIRGRLTEPCMLALPMMRGEGEMQLNVVSDNDRNITALMDDLTAGIEGGITREAVLLDPRQCPAVAFVRRDQRYPVYALGIQLDAQQVARGAALRGQISNGAGYYQSLLLIDENGAVHDMRRFLLKASRVTRFDFAVARYRPSRDTHQMLVALATPERPKTLSSHAGASADDFFDALYAEVGQNVLIGVSSFYVQ